MGLGTSTNEQIINACMGGILLSTASFIHLYLKGQITGMSETLNYIINGEKEYQPQKICILMGTFITSSIFYLVQEQGQFFETVIEFETGLPILGFLITGYFTGLGAKLQNGCISEHVVCGLPNLSIKSFVAVIIFILFAMGSSSFYYSNLFAKYNFNSFNMFQMFNEEGDIIQIIETSIILGISVAVIIIVFIVRYLINDTKMLQKLQSQQRQGIINQIILIQNFQKFRTKQYLLQFLSLNIFFQIKFIYSFFNFNYIINQILTSYQYNPQINLLQFFQYFGVLQSLSKNHKFNLSDYIISILIGAIFSAGLIISGIVKRNIVLGFLNIGPQWNPTLLFILLCAFIPNMIIFWLIRKKTKKPLMDEKYFYPTNKNIDFKLITGAIFFGIGWGIAGISPDTLFCLVPTFYSEVLILFGPTFLLGLQSDVIFNHIKSIFKKKDNQVNISSQDVQYPLIN